MFLLKVITCCATISAAMFFAFWESRLKQQLTDSAVQPLKMVSDLGIVSEQMAREQVLADLPRQAKVKLRAVVALKLLFVAILIAEVLILQR